MSINSVYSGGFNNPLNSLKKVENAKTEEPITFYGPLPGGLAYEKDEKFYRIFYPAGHFVGFGFQPKIAVYQGSHCST